MRKVGLAASDLCADPVGEFVESGSYVGAEEIVENIELRSCFAMALGVGGRIVFPGPLLSLLDEPIG
jgi:hypothetical protein